MKVSPVSNINIKDLAENNTAFSKYAQSFLKSQINSVIFNFKELYDKFNIIKFADKKEVLEKFKINHIGQTKEEGLILSFNNFNYHISLTQNNKIQFKITDNKNKKTFQVFEIVDNKTFNHAGIVEQSDLEDFISEVIDNIESVLISIKRNMFEPARQSTFISSPTTTQKLNDLNNIIQNIKKNNSLGYAVKVNAQEKEMVNSVLNSFLNIRDLYGKIRSDVTKFTLRKNYPAYITEKSFTDRIAFKDAGPLGETMTIFNIVHKHRNYLGLSVETINGDIENYFISQAKGTIQKNLPYLKFKVGDNTKRKNSIPEYYSNEDLNHSKLCSYLSCANRELQNYGKYLENWINNYEIKKVKYSNTNVANLEQYQDVFNNLSKNFKKYILNMRKSFSHSDKRKEFKVNNGISVEPPYDAITFKNLTEAGEDIMLSFPKMNKKRGIRILVLSGDKVKNSFYVLDNKLLKFDIKNIKDRITHYNTNMYFYDEEYLKNSDFEKYLVLTNNKLTDVNNNLKAHKRKKQIFRNQNHFVL